MAEGAKFSGIRSPSLLFADDVVPLASSNSDLQLTLGCFAAECKVAGMRISSSKSEAMDLSPKKMDYSLQVRKVAPLKQRSRGAEVSQGFVHE